MLNYFNKGTVPDCKNRIMSTYRAFVSSL